jgi:hypothetical protein
MSWVEGVKPSVAKWEWSLLGRLRRMLTLGLLAIGVYEHLARAEFPPSHLPLVVG